MSEDSQELDLELSRTARLIRRHCDAFLRFDEHFQPVRYCRATDGRLIVPAMAAMQNTPASPCHTAYLKKKKLQPRTNTRWNCRRAQRSSSCGWNLLVHAGVRLLYL